MSRKGQSITLSISERDKAELENLARELGMMWGDRPNISKLVEAIAQRELLITRNNDWSTTRIEALKTAMQALIDAGQIDIARIIANLLLERSELSIPFRNEIDSFLATVLIPWREELDRYILRQQPFQLSYQDAAERTWVFHVHHAQVVPHEKRQYLDCWCEETEGNQNISQLSHNWSLRLDRIFEAAISPIGGKWYSQLDAIEVEIHLYKHLAFAYQAKPEDQVIEWLTDKPQVKKVIRTVTSTFWFFREIRPLGEDCEIVAPDMVRDLFKQKLSAWCDLYKI